MNGLIYRGKAIYLPIYFFSKHFYAQFPQQILTFLVRKDLLPLVQKIENEEIIL